QRSSHVAVSDRRLHRGRKDFYQHDAAVSHGCALSCLGSGPNRVRGRQSGPPDCRRGSSRTFPAFGSGTAHRCWLKMSEHSENPRPGGATLLSPALQRWEKGPNNSSPGGTTEFSTLT